MTEQSIRLLVVDDHGIVRKGICALLAQVHDMQVVGEASDGEQAIAQAASLKPDVILMDLVMPKVDGVEAIRQILAQRPETRIIALTSFVADDKVFPAIKAGAVGYLLKDSEPEDLLATIRRVHAGEPSLPPSIAMKVLEELSHPKKRPLTPEPLTEREEQVLRLIAQGLDNHTIAQRLTIGEATVRTHVGNILSKLQLANRVQATLYALRQGITSLDEAEKK